MLLSCMIDQQTAHNRSGHTEQRSARQRPLRITRLMALAIHLEGSQRMDESAASASSTTTVDPYGFFLLNRRWRTLHRFRTILGSRVKTLNIVQSSHANSVIFNADRIFAWDRA